MLVVSRRLVFVFGLKILFVFVFVFIVAFVLVFVLAFVLVFVFVFVFVFELEWQERGGWCIVKANLMLVVSRRLVTVSPLVGRQPTNY